MMIQEQLVSSEQLPSESRYYKRTLDETVYPCDPVTGEVMESGQIPESLLQDEELRNGFNFLRDNAKKISVGLLLTRHEDRDDLQEAGIDLEAEARSLVEKDGVLFLEGADSKRSKVDLQRFMDAVSNTPEERKAQVKSVLAASTELPPFMREVAAAITGTGVKTERPDYVVDSEQLTDKLITKWKQDLDSLLQEATNQPSAVNEWLDTNLGFTVYRDFYLIGKIGSFFAQQAEQGVSDFTGKLLVGSNHQNIGTYLEGFGIRVEYKGNDHNEQLSGFRRAAGKLALTAADRETILHTSS